MRIFIIIISLFSFSVFSDDLTKAIKASLQTSEAKNLAVSLKPDLQKIEYFFQSPQVKNHHTIFMTEFINYSLKNPINREYNRYPFKKDVLADDENTIQNKFKQLSPVAKLLAEKVIIEIRVLRQRRDFNNYLERIKKSYYFTSKELKLIDKKMRFIEPWWKFYLQTSPKEINHLFISHLKNFIIHFAKSTNFLLNTDINIPPDRGLTMFSTPSLKNTKLSIEQKLDHLIKDTQLNADQSEQATLKIDKDKIIQSWFPKDEQIIPRETIKNLNGPKNYPKPSPNYIAPKSLPIPMNDW